MFFTFMFLNYANGTKSDNAPHIFVDFMEKEPSTNFLGVFGHFSQSYQITKFYASTPPPLTNTHNMLIHNMLIHVI